MAAYIRKEKHDGLEIRLNNHVENIQISQLADDTTLFLKNEMSILNCLQKAEAFGKVSGLRLNKEKTEGLWLGRHVNRKDTFAGINWNKTVLKALGMYFAYDKKESEKQNWTSKLESIRKSLRWWNTRDLSLKGRILIIKSIALAKVVYLTGALHTPNWVINEINKEFFGFVWKFKRDKLARKVLVNTVDNTGLNMIDF